MTQTLVIDESWAREPAAAVKAAGYVGVIGYVSRDATKSLHTSDVSAYHAEGLGVAFVFEDYALRALGGAPAGDSDGKFANQYLDKLGAPADLPIYYAVDFQATTGQMIQVVSYVHEAGLQGRPSRGYGDASVLASLEASGEQANWQTAAWSGSTVDNKAVLYQRLRPTTGLPGSFDEDVVLGPIATAGFWFPDGAQPAPIVNPAPQPPTQPPVIGPSSSELDLPHVLLVTRSTGEVFAVPEDLAHKTHVGDESELGALEATNDYVVVPKGKFSDAEIDALPTS